MRLTEATRYNLSPIFSLHPGDAWSHIEPALGDPWGEASDADGTVNRVWRVAEPNVHDTIAAELADAELLIADGHHRYETARAYADEIPGDGPHRYTLMCLVSLEDPGLTVFPTHRLLSRLDAAKREALAAGLERLFDAEEVAGDGLDPNGEQGVGVFGYVDSESGNALRLRLRDRDELERALDGKPDAYRDLDAVILETLVLNGILGMSEDDVAAKRGIGYVKSAEVARAEVESGRADCAFLLRPTPIEQVGAVAAAGETMPPKSTYFFPKVPTGIVLNPLS